MMGRVLRILFLAALLLGAGDPSIDWLTIETPNFRIHFDRRNQNLAERLAIIAEESRERLLPYLGDRLDSALDVVIIDDVDTANGSARTIPFDLVRIFAMAPEADSTLGDSDDWLRGLFVHEYIHILHLNITSGIWDTFSSVLGKTFDPNGLLPRFLVEGLATYGESIFTEGGRLRNNAFRMYLRMDVLAGRFRDISEVTGVPVQWPQATVWYLYGSDFVDYVAGRFGPELIVTFLEAIGGALSPVAIQHYAGETFGVDMQQLWDDYAAAAQEEFQAEAAAVLAIGQTPVELLTETAFLHRDPRCLGPTTIGFWFNSGRDAVEIVRLDLNSGRSIGVADVTGSGTLDWSEDGRLVVYSNTARTERFYAFDDLFYTDTTTGMGGRLTVGERAREPAIDPTGRYVAYIAGTDDGSADLRELDLLDGSIQTLFASTDLELASRPDYSPDGSSIVFSMGRLGWSRDLYLLDRRTGELRQLTDDRAQDLDPAFAPGGESVLYASDRSGIYNIYELSLADSEVRQLTNVLGGVFSPRRCSEEGPLIVRSYTATGYAIGSVQPVERPAPPSYERPEVAYPTPSLTADDIVQGDYDPWPDLYPRNWSPVLSEDGEGILIGGEIAASDPLGHHAYTASLTYGLESERTFWGLAYSYGELPFDLGLFLRRSVRTASGRLLAESRFVPFDEESIAAGATMRFPFRDERSGHSFSLGYAFRDVQLLEQPEITHGPSDVQPTFPEFGRFDTVELGWSWSDSRRFAYSLGPADGSTANVNLILRSPITGADFDSVSVRWGFRHYMRGLFERDSIALLLTGGIGRASFNRRALFAVGGPPSQDILLAVLDNTPVGSGLLRGYERSTQVGTQFHLLNTEYRLPLWIADGGVRSLPMFFRQLFLAAFFDYGTATRQLDGLETFLAGVGLELRLEATLGYVVPSDFRFGYARGLDEDGIHDIYVLFGGSF
jgi:hypothetical protein